MPIEFSEAEIERFVQERKPLPSNYRERLKTKTKLGNKRADLDVKGVDGSEFVLFLRQSMANVLDFSVVLGYRPAKNTGTFLLRRYNGKHGEHTNKLEGETFYDFHIHKATERYQEAGFPEETFAEVTDRYADVDGALDSMLHDCGFEIPSDGKTLFDP